MTEQAITLFKNNTLPAYLQGADDDTTAALAGGSGATYRRISIKGGVFREFISGKEYRVSENRYLNVVIVRAAPSVGRQYYAGTYQEGATEAPTCWSDDGTKPHPRSQTPQSANCATCPQNVKGSGQNQESRACRFQQRLAVVLADEIEKGEVYQLIVPAASIFGSPDNTKMPLQAYARFLRNHHVPITGVVTKMSFDTSSAAPKLFFKPERLLTEAEYAQVQVLKDTPDAEAAVTYTASEMDTRGQQPAPALAAPGEDDAAAEAPAKPKPKVAKAPSRAAQTPAPVAPVLTEDDEAEETPPPAKVARKATAQAPVPQAAEDLASVIDSWDDDDDQ